MAILIIAFFLQAASTLPVLTGAEVWTFIYKFLALALPLALGGLKLRDMVLENRRRIEAYEKKQNECQEKQEEKDKEILRLIDTLEEKRQKDLVENSALKGINTVIDNKIEMKVSSVMKEISAQRHEDLMLFKDALFTLEKNFSNTLSDIRETLIKFNVTLDGMSKEVERVKGRKDA